MGYPFGRSRRLLTRSDFQYVFDAPEKRSSDRYFTVLGRLRTTDDASRLGLVIAKRRIQRAHERNRVKRLVRESFRLQMNNGSMDVVLLAKHGAQYADNAQLFTSLQQHWRRLQR